MIKISDWRLREKDIIKMYEQKGLDKSLEIYAISGINLMAALWFILKYNPKDTKAKQTLNMLLEWYGEVIED